MVCVDAAVATGVITGVQGSPEHDQLELDDQETHPSERVGRGGEREACVG